MSNEPMKIPVNYAEASETLRKVLGLNGSPVAIRFATSREEIPAGMEETGQNNTALLDGESCPE
jgi:uncharacterized protein (DUF169 family)